MIATTTQGRALPQFVRDLLASVPKVGEGLNSWLFRVSRVLHPYRSEAEIVALLQSSTHGQHVRQSEIVRAVQNSKAAAWIPGGPLPDAPAAAKWPAENAQEVRRIAAAGPGAVKLWQQSPVRLDFDDGSNCEEILTALFAESETSDPLLCIARNNSEFATRPLSFWLADGRLSDWTLIVPSPMTARTGTTKDGKQSEHCLDNTGERRFLVVEFDKGTADDHAARLWHLAEYAPLALVVHSGGKSLHGWFYCQGKPEASLRKFMAYAVSLGADRATWTRSQFVRLPAGRRENGARQSVFFFSPVVINGTEAA